MSIEVLEIPARRVQEEFFERNWTDGLPIVPPTAEAVDEFLSAAQTAADAAIGGIPARNRVVTAGQVAVNAVMAGCKPEYFPIVLTAVGAMLDPAFNAHSTLSSTGGSAICVLVSGPEAAKIKMNSGHNVLGSGNRANLTIGRAVRLVAMNVLGARAGKYDASSIGTPAKLSFCFAEEVPPEPWVGLNVRLGYHRDDTVVTVMASEGPRQVGQHLNEDPEGVARTFVSALRVPANYIVGKGGQVIFVIGPEHSLAFRNRGWTQSTLQRFLWDRSRISADELRAAGIIVEPARLRSSEDATLLPAVATPEDILLVTAGGAGAGWSACIPSFSPRTNSTFVSRKVAVPGAPLPGCGPHACEVDLDAMRRSLGAAAADDVGAGRPDGG